MHKFLTYNWFIFCQNLILSDSLQLSIETFMNTHTIQGQAVRYDAACGSSSIVLWILQNEMKFYEKRALKTVVCNHSCSLKG